MQYCDFPNILESCGSRCRQREGSAISLPLRSSPLLMLNISSSFSQVSQIFIKIGSLKQIGSSTVCPSIVPPFHAWCHLTSAAYYELHKCYALTYFCTQFINSPCLKIGSFASKQMNDWHIFALVLKLYSHG